MFRYEFNLSDAHWLGGIYYIVIGEHTYIGSTKRSIWVRIKEHERLLRKNKHYNKRLQLAYNQSWNITIKVIEYCRYKDVCNKEQYYIDMLNPDMNIVRKVARY